MKLLRPIMVVAVLSLLLISTSHYAEAQDVTYDPSAAIGYAIEFCSNFNPNYKDEKEYPGVDCANFVSQALIVEAFGSGIVEAFGSGIGNSVLTCARLIDNQMLTLRS